jgi:hypothetical protein
MAANTTPIFTLTPVIGAGQVTTANTDKDGTGDIVTIIVGGTDGTRITKIRILATVTTTDGVVRLFIGDGTTTRLWQEIEIAANTVSATNAGYSADFDLADESALILPYNYTLYASTEKSEAINVFAHGASF